MDALRQPIERVAEATQWFLIAKELRLLYIRTDTSLRLAVLEQIAALEHSSNNEQPFAILEAPVEEDDDGWTLRQSELRDDWLDWTELYAGVEPPISMPELPVTHPEHGLAGFGAALSRAMQLLPADPFAGAGLTLVLAPVWVKDAETWRGSMRALVQRSELARARFIVVESDTEALTPVVDELGALAEGVDARVDTAAARATASQILQGIASAPSGADGPRLAGMAGPSVAPPRRWNAPPEQAPEETARAYFDAELPSGLADQDRVQAMKLAVFQAADAAQRGDHEAAIARQRYARDTAVELGLEREAILMQLVLGSYHLQVGQNEVAEGVNHRGSELAQEYGHNDLAAQCQLAIGSSRLLAKRRLDAADSYKLAGSMAYQTGQNVLGIEAYRTAGQILAQEGRVEEATTAWRTALGIAENAPADERRASTAADVAAELAEFCRSHGLHAQAEALDTQAAILRAEMDEPPATDQGAA